MLVRGAGIESALKTGGFRLRLNPPYKLISVIIREFQIVAYHMLLRGADSGAYLTLSQIPWCIVLCQDTCDKVLNNDFFNHRLISPFEKPHRTVTFLVNISGGKLLEIPISQKLDVMSLQS
jgi:hypothetical protein